MGSNSKKMRSSVALAIGGLLASVMLGTVAVAGPETEILEKTGAAFASVARKAIPAVVFIQVEKAVERGARQGDQFFFNDPHEFFGDEFFRRFFGTPYRQQPRTRKYRQMGQGSGFVISRDGYILTNNHVVGDADRITVRMHDGREFTAKRIGSDPKSEVAVIKIEGDDFPYLELGDSDEMDIGEWVVAVGNPFGLSESVTAGIVSAKGRSNIGIADYENFIQTDAAINPGNSGGPLLNIKAEVIGINTAIYSRTGGYMGIGFAIPINMAKAIKGQLVETGKVVRGYLGVYIQPLTPELAESFGLSRDQEGILVSHVEPGSAAEKAGIKQGDVITELNGQDVDRVGDFRNTVASSPPGTEIGLGIVREGKTESIKAHTGTLPGDEAYASSAEEVTDKLGFTVKELSAELAQQFDYKPGEGVLVTEVESGSLAWQAGIQPGSLILAVDRTSVNDVDAFSKAVAAAGEKKFVMLLVQDRVASRYVVLRFD